MQIGPYRVLEEIARGGAGVVYKAVDDAGQLVALKVLLDLRLADERARARFAREGEALMRLEHPNVVRVHGAGQDQGRPWLALDYVAGESLEARLRRGPLEVPAALAVARDLAAALAHVHAQGLLHRDLKPDNVLLCDGTARLTDFGIALDQGSQATRLTATGAFLGTPGYWSPEQAQGELELLGPETDIYGLGGVLYACLTGQAPVQAQSLGEYFQSAQFQAIPSPRRLRPDVSQWLSDLCMRCLAFSPSARPPSVAAFAELLRVGELGTTSGAAPSAVRSPSPRGPRGTPALAAGGLALLAVVGLAWAGWRFASRPPGPAPVVADERPLGEGALQESTPPSAAAAPSSPRERARVFFRRGKDHLAAQQAPAALEAFLEALRLDPDFEEAHVNLGFCRGLLGRHAEALASFDRALELNPDSAGALTNRAGTLVRLGRFAEAIEASDHALEVSPESAVLYFNRAASKASLGRPAEALHDYSRALEFEPMYADALSGRAAARVALGQTKGALADYDLALELGGPSARIFLSRGIAYHTERRFEEALEDYDRALTLSPDHGVALQNRGLVLTELGRYEEALADYDRARTLGVDAATAARLREWRARAQAALDAAR